MRRTTTLLAATLLAGAASARPIEVRVVLQSPTEGGGVEDRSTRMQPNFDGITWGRRILEEHNDRVPESSRVGARHLKATQVALQELGNVRLQEWMFRAFAAGGAATELNVLVVPQGPDHVGPHYRANLMGYEHAILVSVPYLSKVGFTRPAFREAMIHEAAHAGDTGRCPGHEDPNYGHVSGHQLDEVISPRAAFDEGWANYVAARADLAGAPITAQVRAEHGLELYVDNPDGRRVRIDASDLSIHDLVSNEVLVAQVLLRLDELVGWEGMTRAFQASAGEDCRSLAEFLGAFGRLFRGQRRAAALAIEDIYLLVERRPIGTLVQGSIPAVGALQLVNTEVGRVTPYVPSSTLEGEGLEVDADAGAGAELAATHEETGFLGM